jgi:beta-glucanase (GH16 family)
VSGKKPLPMLSLVFVAPTASSTSKCCWCDDATPDAATTITGSDDKKYDLIFSDEFNTPGREFANGKDAKWTALEIGDTSNKGAAFYLPEQATIATDTVDGVSALLISTVNASHVGDSPTGEKGIYMPFKSAMLQSWNKFCFTGGIVEFKARQPRGGGYWPALWLFGNLGRAVYQNSNTGLWPWSYNLCDEDLVLPPFDPPQRISACDDHSLEEEGLHPFQGRGATELDVLEGAVTNTGKESYVVGSLQLSPGLPPYFRPPLFGFPTRSGAGSWYTGLTFGHGGTDQTDGYANNGWYGPPSGTPCPTGCPDALSGGIVNLDDLDSRYWTYKMEWFTGNKGWLKWFYDDKFVWGMSAASFGAYSVCTETDNGKECTRTPPRMIPNEPMSLVMNTAIGTWNGGASALDGKHWPALFYVDYVRVWQNEMNVGCNPPDYPTKVYIEKNAELYGEPVAPSGYDTCPEIYPPSSYKAAALFADNAKAERAARAAGRSGAAKVGYTSAASMSAGLTNLAAAVGSTASPAEDAPRSQSSMGAIAPLLGLAAVAAVVAAGVRHRRPPSLSTETSAVVEREYEEFQRYGPITSHPNLG